MLFNIHAVHMNPSYWDQPKVFKPERFLTRANRDHLIPFGIGKRICMGESLAKAELFLMVIMILQHIEFRCPASHPDANDDVVGITRAPKPFHVRIAVRE